MIGGDILFFDDFSDNQNVSYSLLKKSLLHNRLSHAYLFDCNNWEYAYDYVLAFIKMILCEKNYSSYSDDRCFGCHLCDRIQDGNYSEVKVIEAESNIIKKEQLLELQDEFSRTNIEGKYRIYIIRDCDKMNKHAANSLLKFLEEPVDGIIAILMTNHFSKVLSTIISRCQVIHLHRVLELKNISSFNNLAYVCCDNVSDISVFLDDTFKNEIMDSVIDFVNYFEDNGLDILLFMKKMWYNKVQSREDSIFAFQIMVYFYYDILKFKLGCGEIIFCSHMDLIKKISSLNSVDVLVKKIDIIQYGYDMILSNLNTNLLLDDVIIRLGEINEYS